MSSTERVLAAGGQGAKALYDLEGGLTCYKEEFKMDSGQVMVREGYLETITLPNGTKLVKKRQTRVLTKELSEMEG